MGDSVLEECEALHRAVRLRRHALCQPLVRTHSPAIITHFSPKTGQTALHAAVKEGLHDILVFFLQHKDIDIDVLDSRQRSSVVTAVLRRRMRHYLLLANAGANLFPSLQDESLRVLCIIARGDVDSCKQYFAGQANPTIIRVRGVHASFDYFSQYFWGSFCFHCLSVSVCLSFELIRRCSGLSIQSLSLPEVRGVLESARAHFAHVPEFHEEFQANIQRVDVLLQCDSLKDAKHLRKVITSLGKSFDACDGGADKGRYIRYLVPATALDQYLRQEISILSRFCPAHALSVFAC
eukprot:m.136867 g.136867  ORF g.136867 m.136867 type:complete len:294 (-) comp52482_c0_seq2:85-966(-)